MSGGGVGGRLCDCSMACRHNPGHHSLGLVRVGPQVREEAGLSICAFDSLAKPLCRYYRPCFPPRLRRYRRHHVLDCCCFCRDQHRHLYPLPLLLLLPLPIPLPLPLPLLLPLLLPLPLRLPLPLPLPRYNYC